MGTETPGRRLVHKQHYLGTLLEKGGLYAFAMGGGAGGLLLLLLGLLLLWMGLPPWNTHDPDEMDRVGWFIGGGLFVLLSFAAYWFSVHMIKTAQAIEPVAPITRHNTGQLPAAETLVRGSQRPAVEGAHELLRAARHGVETPPEQLLRATQGNRQRE